MKTYTFGTQNFAIHESSAKGGVWLVQFIWGKKDFRIYLGRRPAAGGDGKNGVLMEKDGAELIVTSVQYLNNFEWYEYDGVGGHGLALEEVRFRKGKLRRYVELPKDFLDTAVVIAAEEFGLSHQAGTRKAG